MTNRLKHHFPNLYRLLKVNYIFWKNKEYLRNYFKSDFKKRALLSYTTLPFKQESKIHTNFFEAKSIAEILDELGYVVDIINSDYTGDLNYEIYDLLIGSGNAFENYFFRPRKQLQTICYCTGLHPHFQNDATLKRLKAFYTEKKLWIGQSCRYVSKSWTHQINLSDHLLVLGNNTAKESFIRYNNNIHLLPTPFYNTIPSEEIHEFVKNRDNNFLWIGGSGLIHKGLDLVLDFFLRNTHLNLWILGNIQQEADFYSFYKGHINSSKNIEELGFVDVESDDFKTVLSKCTFVIVPSASEGGSPALVTAVGNAGLIPIHNKESSVDFKHSIQIKELSLEGIKRSIDLATNLTNDEVYKMRLENYLFTNSFHGNSNYRKKLKAYLTQLTV